MTRSGRPGAGLTCAAVVMLALGACGGTASQGSSGDASSPSGTTIEITIEGDSVTPNGERVEVEAGKPVTLEVTADAPGELHVHSTPEQELEYDKGTTTLTLTIDQPGIVDVESHALGKVIVQLEVS